MDLTHCVRRIGSSSLFLGWTSFIFNQQQLGRPVGRMPPPPSVGQPGLPDLGTIDGTPMKYTHNRACTRGGHGGVGVRLLGVALQSVGRHDGATEGWWRSARERRLPSHDGSPLRVLTLSV
jgi:hypothetical protein